MAREIFQIEDGKLYLAVVDTEAVGYDTDWLAPGWGQRHRSDRRRLLDRQ